ncbi:hypothetical protein ACHAWF_013937, partial [Thalassiosira exigua]
RILTPVTPPPTSDPSPRPRPPRRLGGAASILIAKASAVPSPRAPSTALKQALFRLASARARATAGGGTTPDPWGLGSHPRALPKRLISVSHSMAILPGSGKILRLSFVATVAPAASSITFGRAMSATTTPAPPTLESRLRSALWGMFAGDALASPAHWYYGGLPQIKGDYGPDGITGYAKPVTNLPGSILNKSDPNGGGRRSSFPWNGLGGKEVTIVGDVINHDKLKYWDPKKSFHYHATLRAGENTLEMQLARVLMKSIVANDGRFAEDHFRRAYVEFMTREGSHNDTYASTCHRMFFANMIFREKDPKDCPDNDGHNVDTVDGLVLPSVTALAETARHLARSDGGSLGLTEEGMREVQRATARTAAVTRSSDVLEKVSEVWSSLIAAALVAPVSEEGNVNEMERPLVEVAQRLGLPSPRPNRRDQMRCVHSSLPRENAHALSFRPHEDSLQRMLPFAVPASHSGYAVQIHSTFLPKRRLEGVVEQRQHWR